MNAVPASRWQRVLQQCTQQLHERWPARPATEQPSNQALQAGFLFSGQSHEVVPRRLLLDNRLTPLERNAWQVFRLMLQGQGVVTPRYEDLQPYLSSVPYGESASRETIARVLTMLRLTRWLSLVSRGRDQISGRLQGSLYVLHDEPLTPAEAMELDQDYLELVGHALGHATKAVRIVAQQVVEEVRQDTNIDQGRLPTRLDSWGEQWAQQGLDQPAAQFKIIKRLLSEATTVVIATDADREGEMIARELLELCRYQGTVQRLWLSALNEASIRRALTSLKSGQETFPLYHSALARSRADWLIGMNLSRLFTCVGYRWLTTQPATHVTGTHV